MALKAVPVRIGDTDAVRLGLSRYSLKDPYYSVLTVSWPGFFGLVIGFFILANLVFATLYYLDPHSVAGARPDAFLDKFFFSVETLATVGYGVMAPNDIYGHVVSSLEIWFGLLLSAVILGLVYARFSRPRARLMFSDVAVVAPYEGKRAIMIRLVSERSQGIADAQARMMVLRQIKTPEGHVMRRFTDLKLVRSFSPVMALSWTLIHVIDEASPLWGKSAEEMESDDSSLFVSIGGYDEAISAWIVGRKTYPKAKVLHGHAFEDIMCDSPDGRIILDLTRFHETRAMKFEEVTADTL